MNESVRTTEAVVRGYIDPSVAGGELTNPTPSQATAIDADLVRLVSAGKILRIKVWSMNGTVVFSDLPALRGRQFPIDGELAESLEGLVATSFSAAADEENIFERGLADQFLSIYLPIRAPGSGTVIGAYEVYEDAAPIVAEIGSTSQDVLLIVGGMGLGLLALLFAAFSGASRLLTNQNRRLLEQSINEQSLTADLRRSQERFQIARAELGRRQHDPGGRRDDRVRELGGRARPRLPRRGSDRSRGPRLHPCGRHAARHRTPR